MKCNFMHTLLKWVLCVFIIIGGKWPAMAQYKRVKPANDKLFLAYFSEAQHYLATDTLKAALHIQGLDSLCNVYEKDFPLYIATIRLWQSWYQVASHTLPQTVKITGNRYLENAYQKIRNNEKIYVDSFSVDILNLGLSFKDIQQLNYFKPIDKLIRVGCGNTLATENNDFTVTFYAWSLFMNNQVASAANLAAYDALYFTTINSQSNENDQLPFLFNKTIIINNQYREWKKDTTAFKLDYLEAAFNYWASATELWLYNTHINYNRVGSSAYDANKNAAYVLLYQHLIIPFAEISIINNNMGLAAIQLNRYVKNVLLPFVEANSKMGNINYLYYEYLCTCGNLLSEMYYQIGENQRAVYSLISIKKVFCKADGTWIDSIANSTSIKTIYYIGYAKHHTALGNIAIADACISILKYYYPQPNQRGESAKNIWDGYVYTRALEVECLYKTGRKRAAKDSLLKYYEIIYNKDESPYPANNHEAYWEFVVGKILIDVKAWDMANSFLKSAITNAKQNYFYDRLFYYDLIAAYLHTTAKLNHTLSTDKYLETLVNYTKEQIQKNILSLSPDQRIIFFENRLLSIFNLYHSLIAEGVLHSNTALKNKILSQSISVKNVLLGNNEILQNILAHNNKADYIKKIIAIKQRATLFEAEAMLLDNTGMYKEFDDLKDEVEYSFRLSLNDKILDSISALVEAEKIAKVLQKDDVYLEFIRFNNLLKGDTMMYAALTVNNSNNQFTFKTLFTEENLLKIMSNKAASPQLAALYSPNQRSVSIRKNKEDSTKNNTLSVSPKDKLSALIFDSLQSIIQDKVNIIFIPDGYLNRISFAALHMNNQFLFQQYNLKQLSASRILFNKPDTSKKNNFLLAGGINYGAENCTIKNRFLAQNISWNYLPGSLKEINALYKNVSAKVNTTFISNNNLTDTFNLSQYNYIHFATHGFYLDTADVNIYFDTANYQINNIKKMPLLRSGIVLSNANCPNQKNTRENGYLLGYELAAQDLTQCKLITLSACESALGDIKSNLGVMGLQRAIKLAGAQKMLITLWKIPDTETAEFMQLFYNYFFIKKYSAEEALKNTQLVMSKKYAVSKWGAFVLIQ